MSTRRARIKAVATLPVRRKNVGPHGNVQKSESVSNIHQETRAVESESEKVSCDLPKQEYLTNNEDPVINESIFHGSDAQNNCSNTESVLNKNDATNDTNKILSCHNLSNKPPVQLNLLQYPESASEVVITSDTIQDSAKLKSSTSNNITSLEGKNTLANDLNSPTKTTTPKIINHAIEDNQPKSVCTRNLNPLDIPVIEADGVDGITPLKSAQHVPKPIDVLKNEIISENVEVIFDPIVPLPSPSKVRTKLRPTPRLAPYRRNSVQGSASESEDENRKTLTAGCPSAIPPRIRHNSQSSVSTHHTVHSRETARIRNDSVSSAVSQSVVQLNTPSSPFKEKHLVNKCRRTDNSRRAMALRRRQRARDGVSKEALTMYDLIFYNPTTNPIIPDRDEERAREEVIISDDAKHNDDEKDVSVVEEVPSAVPQIKLGPDGQIVLDEKSLVIERSGGGADGARRLSGGVVREGEWGGGRGRYTRAARSAEWTDAETVRFYRALASLGTDFSLMAPLFPGRTRRELKIKFKKEERTNLALVDKALRSQIQWDAAKLEAEFTKERQDDAERKRCETESLKKHWHSESAALRTAKQMGLKLGKAAKCAGAAILPPDPERPEIASAEDLIQLVTSPRRKKREEKNTALAKKAKPCYIMPPVTGTHNVDRRNNTIEVDATIPNNITIRPKISRTVVPADVNPIEVLPDDIEIGSLVVLTTTDPNSPSRKVLQTYMSDSSGQIKPVNIPPHLLDSVIGLVNKGGFDTSAPRAALPQLTAADASLSPTAKDGHERFRRDSYTITQL